MLKNPLDVEVNLANLTINVETMNTTNDIDVEVIDNIYLLPKENRIVSIMSLLVRYFCLF